MELNACRHPVHDEQTNFQNVTEISFLPSSFWNFIVTANCLLLGAHVLIVMGALQIYIDYDDDDLTMGTPFPCVPVAFQQRELPLISKLQMLTICSTEVQIPIETPPLAPSSVA